MNTAMIVTWRNPVPGREGKALAYAQEVSNFWGKVAADGKCTAPEAFYSHSAHNIWLVKGDSKALRPVMNSPEARRLEAEGRLLLEDFSVELMLAGDAGTQFMEDFATVAGEQGLA